MTRQVPEVICQGCGCDATLERTVVWHALDLSPPERGNFTLCIACLRLRLDKWLALPEDPKCPDQKPGNPTPVTAP